MPLIPFTELQVVMADISVRIQGAGKLDTQYKQFPDPIAADPAHLSGGVEK